jgi:hypothetical protein
MDGLFWIVDILLIISHMMILNQCSFQSSIRQIAGTFAGALAVH